jgi:hypothetical protein
MAGVEWTRRIFREQATAARMLSLHSADPGDSGAALLAGPFRLNPQDLRVEARALSNPRELSVGPATRAGRARYIGFWTNDRVWIKGVALDKAEDLRAGLTVTFARGALRLELR